MVNDILIIEIGDSMQERMEELIEIVNEADYTYHILGQ